MMRLIIGVVFFVLLGSLVMGCGIPDLPGPVGIPGI